LTFNGFISYSHAADGRLAPAIQRGLHRLAKPWHRRRALWIFRDQTGLAVTPGLWSSIQTALDGSDYFVLLASPEAARSRWVNREIEHWVATKSADRILPVVTDGEWRWDPVRRDFAEGSTAVPAALRGVFVEEPLFLDLRWARDDLHLSLRHSRFRDAIAQLAAPMHGVSKDDLEGEDVRQHRRARRLRLTAVATLVALALVASLTSVLAVRYAERANTKTAEALRQQHLARDERGNADRSAQEARRQEQLARQQQALAKDAADEARRQAQVALEQKALAERSSAEAQRQQENARQQHGIADRAADEARRQQGLSDRAAAEARRQEQVARQQEQLAGTAAAEARRQQGIAEQQQRIAIGRRLINQAKASINDDPKTALQLALAAQKVQLDPEARRELTGLVTTTRYAGALSGVTAVAFGADGALAVKGEHGGVSLWNVANRANPVQLAPLIPDGSSVRQIAVSPDGRTLAAVGPDGAELWDVAHPTRPARIGVLSANAESVTFSPDGRTVATRDSGSTPMVSLWDIANRSEPAHLCTIASTPSAAMAFSPNGRLLVQGKGGQVWDVTNRTDPTEITMLDEGRHIASLAFGGSGSMLAAGNENGTVDLWDLRDPADPRQTGTVAGITDRTGSAGKPYSVQSIVFSSDGLVLASGDAQGTVTLSYVADPHVPFRLDIMPGHGGVQSMAFSADGRTLVAVGNTTATLWSVGGHAAPEPLGRVTDAHGRASGTQFRSNGSLLATAGEDGGAAFWDVTHLADPVQRATMPTKAAGWVAFSPDGRTAAVADFDATVTLWDVADPTRAAPLGKFHQSVIAWSPMVFTADGRTLAVRADGGVVLWDLTNRANPVPLARLDKAGAPPEAVAFSPDGQTVAIGGDDRKVTLWGLTDRTQPGWLAELSGFGAEVMSVVFSPDGHTLATGSGDNTAMLWDVRNRPQPHLLARLTVPGSGVNALAFSPDGGILVSGQLRPVTTTMWDVGDRTKPIRLAMLNSTGDAPEPVTSPDGRTLAVVVSNPNESSTVTLWDYAELNHLRADPASYACVITGRGLTSDEWARYLPEFPYQPTCPA
jgi:WD40 repeat protein